MTSRRALLRAGAGGLAALAGCRAPRGDATPSPRTWLYPPGTVGGDPHAAVFALDLDRVRAHATELPDRTVRKYRGYVRTLTGPDLPVDAGTVTRSLQVFPTPTTPEPQAAVLHGRFDRDSLHDALATSYATRTGRGGATVYADAGGRAVGLADDALLFGTPLAAPSGEAIVAALLAARDGGPRYAAANPALGAVLDVLGRGDDVSARTHQPTLETDGPAGRFADEVARGHRYRFRGSRTRSRYAFAFVDPGASEAAVPAVETWVAATDRLFGTHETVDVRRAGRTVVVEGERPTATV